MPRRLAATLLHDTHAQEPLAWATYIAFGLAVLPTFGALAASIEHHQWVGVTFFGLFLSALSFLAYTQLRWRRPIIPEDTSVFQPFVALPQLDAWPRPIELNLVCLALNNGGEVLPLMVGPSGSGKTVVLQRLLRDQLDRQGVHHHYIDEYAGFRERLMNTLESLTCKIIDAPEQDYTPTGDIPIIILDQFEQYLAALRRLQPDRREQEQTWFSKTIANARIEHRCEFLISIRNEWYYDLRWLGDMIPSPASCVSIGGPRIDAINDLTRVAIATRFERVLYDDSVVESTLTALGRGPAGKLLLLETQIVGAVLERDKLLGAKIDAFYVSEKLGGVEGAIDKYFENTLAGAPDRRVALKVLCALSVRTYFRRQEDLTDLLDRLFEDPVQVREALSYLIGQRLLVTRPTARYELAHDYLAEYFHQKSGSELDPTDRDNVLYHFEGDGSVINDFVAPRVEHEEPKRGRFGMAVVGPLILLDDAAIVAVWAAMAPLRGRPEA